MSAIVRWSEHSLALLFFGIGMKTDLFQSCVATAKFADILSAALSQHHLLGFEVAQLEFHHLCYSPWGRKESDMTERLSMHHDMLP